VTITGLLATSLLVCTLVLPSRLRSLSRVRHRDGHPQPPGTGPGHCGAEPAPGPIVGAS
jgi:hypothetical protein